MLFERRGGKQASDHCVFCRVRKGDQGWRRQLQVPEREASEINASRRDGFIDATISVSFTKAPEPLPLRVYKIGPVVARAAANATSRSRYESDSAESWAPDDAASTAGWASGAAGLPSGGKSGACPGRACKMPRSLTSERGVASGRTVPSPRARRDAEDARGRHGRLRDVRRQRRDAEGLVQRRRARRRRLPRRARERHLGRHARARRDQAGGRGRHHPEL